MRALGLLVVLVLGSSEIAAAQTVLWFAGGETGTCSNENTAASCATLNDTQNCGAGVAGAQDCTAAGTPPSGAYCYCWVGSSPSTTSQICSKRGLGLTTAFARITIMNNGSNAFQSWVSFGNAAATHFINVGFSNGSGGGVGNPVVRWALDVIDPPVASGTTVFANGVYHVVDIKAVVSAGAGGVEVKIDGSVEFTSLGTNTSSLTAIDHVCFGPGFTGISNFRFDDLMVCSGAYCPSGGTIARQGTAGSPTYTAWTLNSCSTIQECWSETPFSATKNASTATASAAQSMVVFNFAAPQTGHGSQIINSGATINACKTAGVIKSGTAAAPLSLRRRITSVDTDTVLSLTTSDAYYDDGIWTTTATVLRDSAQMEVGAVHGTGVATDTVEDMWLLCDATLSNRGVIHHKVNNQ